MLQSIVQLDEADSLTVEAHHGVHAHLSSL